MTKANRNIGFDPDDPIIRNTDIAIRMAAPVLSSTIADWVTPITATYVWLADEPRDGLVQSPLIAIAKASMTITATATGIEVVIPIPGSMTLPLDAVTFYHELRMISAIGKPDVPFTGYVKLTAGA